MADHSNIEWTDATWNPITGCSLVSPGCTNCYAMKLAGTRLRQHPSRAGLTQESKAGPVWNGQVRLNKSWLGQPIEWKKPRRIFVCAHGDLFHESVPDEWIDIVFCIMAIASHHTFQVLTKRPRRARDYLAKDGRLEDITDHWYSYSGSAKEPWGWPLPNVWLGVSVEDQARADERIPLLLETQAAVHFISAEPLLGQVSLAQWLPHFPKGTNPRHPAVKNLVKAAALQFGGHLIDWVITGGESGPGARPMHPWWARRLRDECRAAGVAFFFKQWGNFKPSAPVYPEEDRVWQQCWIDDHHPGEMAENWDLSSVDAFDFMKEFPDLGVLYSDGHFYSGEEWQPHVKSGCWWMERVSKKEAGRKLDGREWNEYPEVKHGIVLKGEDAPISAGKETAYESDAV